MRDRINAIKRGFSSSQSWLENIPFVCKWTAVLLVCIQFVVEGCGLPPPCFSLSHFALHRLLLSIFCHEGWIHLLFNCSALLSIGTSLERRMASARFFVTLISAVMLNLVTHVAVELLFTRFLWFKEGCHVGFSGVLFSLYVLDVSVHSTHRVGCFILPSIVAPFFLLAVLQLLVHASFTGRLLVLFCFSELFFEIVFVFTGHLSGIVVGHLFLRFEHRFQKIELWMESKCASLSGFVKIEDAAAVVVEENVVSFPSLGVLPFWNTDVQQQQEEGEEEEQDQSLFSFCFCLFVFIYN
jgi:membrane associated rhomboid family serine protease